MTTIPFKNIPANLRVPFFYAELDNSKANTEAFVQRALLIGQMTSDGTLTPNVPVICASQSDGRAAAGLGSVLAGMIDAYRAADPYGEVWLLPLSDDPAATAAVQTVTFTGTTTAAGTLSLYIGGRLVSVPLASAQTAAQVATAVVAAISATAGLPVTATVAAGVITLTARNKGEVGSLVDARVNYLGAAGGEATPAGLSAAFATVTAGATNPSLTTALGNLLATPFDFIACSLTDATSTAAIKALLNDTNGRWSWLNQVYGHAFLAYPGSAGAAAAFATALNNQHLTVIPSSTSPTPGYKWAAGFAGAAAVAIRQDPGRPLQSLVVPGLLAPAVSGQFNISTRNFTLLYGGVSTWTADAAGEIVMENIITTYVTNASGQADNSYLEIETLYKIMYILRRLNDVFTAKYARMKLADNGTRLNPGSNTVTPNIIRADIIAAYRELEGEGQVDDSDVFAANLTVERDAVNRSRVNILFPGVLTGQLRTLALLFQFRL